MKTIIPTLMLACMVIGIAQAGVPNGAETQYYVQGAREGHTPPILRARIVARGSEQADGKTYRWWELTMEKDGGGVLGMRILSEQVPMTSASAPGEIVRYIYSPSPGVALEYRDERTGRVLLPFIQFESAFLPDPSQDARYTDGFATTGRLLGHVLVRGRVRDDFPAVSFENVKVLDLRSDLLIGAQTDERVDNDPTYPADQQKSKRPYTQADYEEMIAAGANYFGAGGEVHSWLVNQPVFWRGRGVYPDDFYRSNYSPSRMFIDEPVIRFGWNEHVPGHPPGPEAFAEAIRTRFEAYELPDERQITTTSPPGWIPTGALDLRTPLTAVWETQFWSAYYQLAGGAPGTVHEGRYRERGYGYQPESLFGEGLENLDTKDMFNYYYAFLRGAARAHDGWWGTAIYSESDPMYRLPAMIDAYDKGAKMIWFWTWSDVDFKAQVRLTSALMEHARKYPRRSPEECLRQAEVGIALPPDYCFDENGIWGMNREELNDDGVSYGAIADAYIWEGILSSRKGQEYDFLVDHPGIEKLGYGQLYIIQTDGSVKAVPERKEVRAPKDLILKLEEKPKAEKAGDMSAAADFHIARAPKVSVDADLAEWSEADWVVMDGDPYMFGDNYVTTVTLTVPDTVTPETKVWAEPIEEGRLPMTYMGFRYAQMTPELIEKHKLEFWPSHSAVIVTEILPGSPAEQAGLRVGDAIYKAGGRRAIFEFELYRELEPHRKKPGDKIELELKRNGDEFYEGSSDLSARTAFMLDDDYLYVAAEVRDDVHRQNQDGRYFWKHDCVQIGFDPILERLPGEYSENNHEIGLALHNGEPIAWRGKGRRGQPFGDMVETAVTLGRKPGVEVAARRVGDKTLYEAAVPVSELAPFAPDMWPKMGMNIVVNDCDGGEDRELRLEYRPGAMTAGKRPAEFAVFECAPSTDGRKLSAAIFWEKRSLQPGGHASLTVAVGSPETKSAEIRAELRSLDDPRTKPARAQIGLPVSPKMKEYTLDAVTSSPPGRYSLSVTMLSSDGRVAARDELPVFIYP